jgi:hypothetical protein
MITYVLTVSEFFPKTHNKASLPTGFINAISKKWKKHTIRGNYVLWLKRFKKINEGKAVISVRSWSGKPYRSTQTEHFVFDKDDKIGLEKIEFDDDKDDVPCLRYPLINNNSQPSIFSVAENDGLSLQDFKEWFKNYDLNEPMAIIHFTSFRYCN